LVGQDDVAVKPGVSQYSRGAPVPWGIPGVAQGRDWATPTDVVRYKIEVTGVLFVVMATEEKKSIFPVAVVLKMARSVLSGHAPCSRWRLSLFIFFLFAIMIIPDLSGAAVEDLSVFPQDELSDLERRAAAGDAQSQFQLGLVYAEGADVPRSFSVAAQWFHQAAAQGIVRAQYNLGILYEAGAGVPRSAEQALYWYRIVAEASRDGSRDAFGPGPAKSEAEVLEWYKAIAHEHVFAPSQPIIADADVSSEEDSAFPDADWFDESGTEASRRRALRLRRMHNDMRYATDTCFGDHRDLWYADVTRPNPSVEPSETEPAEETRPRPRPDRRDPSGDADSPTPPSEPSVPSEPSPLPPAPPSLPPEPPPGGG